MIEAYCKYRLVPEATVDALAGWIFFARPVGGFLEAVLSNDLKNAFGRADEDNRAAMFHIVALLYNCAPLNCWGSVENYKSWPYFVEQLEEE